MFLLSYPVPWSEPAPFHQNCRGTSIDDIKVVVEHPNGIEPYVTFLTEKNEEHRVESDQGEGGYTYKVCFQSLQPTGSRTRVEVRDQQRRETSVLLATTKRRLRLLGCCFPSADVPQHSSSGYELSRSASENLLWSLCG